MPLYCACAGNYDLTFSTKVCTLYCLIVHACVRVCVYIYLVLKQKMQMFVLSTDFSLSLSIHRASLSRSQYFRTSQLTTT